MRMTDAELLDQLSTFLFAGSDSTSIAISWCLHLLSLHPDIQTRLRQEIFSLSNSPTRTSSPSTDDERVPSQPPSASSWNSNYSEYAESDAIDNLSLLDAVVRETLRLSPPVHGTIRVATQTDSIPVSSPVVLRDGTLVPAGGSITIGKGSYVHIPIEGLNFSTDIWGNDARIFK
jgi:cytochrome P450